MHSKILVGPCLPLILLLPRQHFNKFLVSLARTDPHFSEAPHKDVISSFEVASVSDALKQMAFLFQENIVLRRVAFFPQNGEDPTVQVYSYVHSAKTGAPEIGNKSSAPSV